MLAVKNSARFYHCGQFGPERNCRSPLFREMTSDVVYLLVSGLDSFAMDAFYRNAKDGDVLLVQFGKGVMQRDAQKMRRARQA